MDDKVKGQTVVLTIRHAPNKQRVVTSQGLVTCIFQKHRHHVAEEITDPCSAS